MQKRDVAWMLFSCPIFLDKAHGISLDWHQKSSKYTVKLCPVTFR